MTTSYYKHHLMCEELIVEFAGGRGGSAGLNFPTRPTILRSKDLRTVEVVWNEFENMLDEERADMIMEAMHSALGWESTLKVFAMSGHTSRLTTTIGK